MKRYISVFFFIKFKQFGRGFFDSFNEQIKRFGLKSDRYIVILLPFRALAEKIPAATRTKFPILDKVIPFANQIVCGLVKKDLMIGKIGRIFMVTAPAIKIYGKFYQEKNLRALI